MDDINPELLLKIQSALSQKDSRVGDTNFTDEERLEMRRYLSTNSGSFFSITRREVLTVLLISTTKNYKYEWSGKQYWDRIQEEINLRPDYVIDLPEVFRCLKQYGKPTFSGGGKSKYVETLFYQAYSPRTSVNSFIKFAWKIYSGDSIGFDYVESDDNLDYCRWIVENLKNRYSNSEDLDDDISFGSETYSIRAGLRYAFKQASEESALLLNRILLDIDSIYKNQTEFFSDEDFLGSTVSNVVGRIISCLGKTDSRKRRLSVQAVNGLSKIRVTYQFDEESHLIYLSIPRIRLLDEEKDTNEEIIKVFVTFENGEEIPIGDSQTFKAVGLDFDRAFKEVNIPICGDIQSFCQDGFRLRVVVYKDDEEHVAFDSKKDLFRDFLLFKGVREAKGDRKPGEYFLVVPPIGFDFKKHSAPSLIHQEIVNNIFVILPKENDWISYNSSFVFFGSHKTDAHIFIDTLKTRCVDQLKCLVDGEEYDVLTSIGNLIIHLDSDINPKEISILAKHPNGKVTFYKTSDCIFNQGAYSLSLSQEPAPDILDCFVSVFVFSQPAGQGKILFKSSFAVDRYASLKFGGLCSFFSDKPIVAAIHLFGQDYKVSGIQNQPDIEGIAGNGFTISVEFPYLCWRINQGETHWSSLSESRPLLTGDISSNDLLCFETNLGDVTCTVGGIDLQKSQSGDSFLLGDFVNNRINTELLAENPLIEVGIKSDSDKHLVCGLTKEPYIIDSSSLVDFGDGRLTLSLLRNYVGNQNTVFEVEFTPITGGETVVKNGQFALEPLTIDRFVDGIYRVQLFSIEGIGEASFKKSLFDDEMAIGDADKIAYQGVTSVSISKASKIKFKIPAQLTDIVFYEDDGFGPIYACKLAIPGSHRTNAYFMDKSGGKGNNIDLFYYKGEEKIKEPFSVDAEKRMLCQTKPDGRRYIECYSIYSRKE